MKKSVKTKKQTRTRYSPEFKDLVLVRVKTEGVAQVARDLGIAESLIYNWRAKQSQTGHSHEEQKLNQAELAQLKRDNLRLQQEVEFLKKTAKYFAKDSGSDAK